MSNSPLPTPGVINLYQCGKGHFYVLRFLTTYFPNMFFFLEFEFPTPITGSVQLETCSCFYMILCSLQNCSLDYSYGVNSIPRNVTFLSLPRIVNLLISGAHAELTPFSGNRITRIIFKFDVSSVSRFPKAFRKLGIIYFLKEHDLLFTRSIRCFGNFTVKCLHFLSAKATHKYHPFCTPFGRKNVKMT